MSTLSDLQFDQRFVRELPGDPETTAGTRQVFGACYSHAQPTAVRAPTTLAVVPEVAEMLGIDEAMRTSPEFARVFAGNALLEGMSPYAACYGGHQFGNWAGQLGDGRAITLGEVVTDSGHLEVQLKGAGPTPYSRRADGRAVLRSSVRELLCSEAMHHLGVPTTRALCLVLTGDTVVRDMFYSGDPRPEPGAITTRVAPSFLRFGSYQIHTARRDTGTLRVLADHTLAHHFPHLDPGDYTGWLHEVCQRTAAMVVHWMRVGFVHGVMNTDNMSILGLTIDYGPYGWIDDYNLDWTPNTTDAERRRYRFGQQPAVAGWNLARFAESLHPLIGAIEPLEAAMEGYGQAVSSGLRQMMQAKLGLRDWRDGDEALLDDLPAALTEAETDMTLFYRHLSSPLGDDPLAVVRPSFYDPTTDRPLLHAWLTRYARRVAAAPHPRRKEAMDAVNPLYVLRNYLAQQAIEAAEQGDPSALLTLLDVMRSPYTEQPGRHAYAARRPEWARHKAGCSMLSCSS